MVAKVKQLNDIRPGLGAPDLTLVLKNGETRDGKVDEWFEF